MKTLSRCVAVAVLLALGACASAPQPDLTPAKPKLDAKSSLESGR